MEIFTSAETIVIHQSIKHTTAAVICSFGSKLAAWQNCKDVRKKIYFFKISRNMIERCTNMKKMKNKKYRKVKMFTSDIISLFKE